MRKVRKYTDAERLEAVQKVLHGVDSIRGVARILGANAKVIHTWVALYERHGEKGLFQRTGSYSGDFKRKVVEYKKANHLSLLETAVKFCIPNKCVILNWERLYDQSGVDSLYRENRGKMKKPKKPKATITNSERDIQKELEYLRAENAYLKKLQALVEKRIARESGKEPKPSKD